VADIVGTLVKWGLIGGVIYLLGTWLAVRRRRAIRWRRAELVRHLSRPDDEGKA
jgi:hypothetical protein